MTDVTGVVTSCGLYDGQRLREMIGHVHFDRCAVLGQPLTDVDGSLCVSRDEPEALQVRDLKADLFGGKVGGQARVVFGPAVRYDLYLQALQVRLEQFAKQNPSVGVDVSGAAQAALSLHGEGTDVSGLRGAGNVEVRNGKLYRLPLLLDLLKWLGLRQPDRTAFEDVRVRFGTDGDRILVRDLDLVGNAISLRGQGSVGLYGDLRPRPERDPAAGERPAAQDQGARLGEGHPLRGGVPPGGRRAGEGRAGRHAAAVRRGQ